jgi:hypothetical protein
MRKIAPDAGNAMGGAALGVEARNKHVFTPVTAPEGEI